jgi:O-antigen ligase
MIRLTLLWAFVAFLSLYAWRDWYKALCGVILLMAVVEHPDMPKSLFGIQGLNPWNIALAAVLLAWVFTRARERLRFDLSPGIVLLLLAYFGVIVIGFFRLLDDPGGVYDWALLFDRDPPPEKYFWSEHLINTIKWVIPGLLLYDGCRDRQRFAWATFAVLGVYFLLAVQVIRWMPLEMFGGGAELERRSAKILLNEVGYHRVNLAVMLAGGAWAIFAARVLAPNRMWALVALAASAATFFGLALSGGRAGFGTWLIIGCVLLALRWRRYLLLVPAAVLVVALAVPAVWERFTQGFDPQSRDTSRPAALGMIEPAPEEVDLYTVTAGRNVAWPYVIEKIAESPWIGYGREAMMRTGLAAQLWLDFAESFPHPHNAYLQWLLDNGWLGFIPVMLFYLIVLRRSLVLLRDGRDPLFVAAGGMALALVGAWLVGGLGSQTFYPREGAVGMWCAMFVMLRVWRERLRWQAGEASRLFAGGELTPAATQAGAGGAPGDGQPAVTGTRPA